jgi:hypothetical protein
VRLDIGPIPSDGAQEWIDQARFLVGLLRAGVAELPFAVPPEVLDEFDTYFADWEIAAKADPFSWSREVDLVALRTLMQYWLNLAQMLADRPENQPPGSPEARIFYRTLVAAILAELVAADPDSAPLQERWPFI